MQKTIDDPLDMCINQDISCSDLHKGNNNYLTGPPRAESQTANEYMNLSNNGQFESIRSSRFNNTFRQNNVILDTLRKYKTSQISE